MEPCALNNLYHVIQKTMSPRKSEKDVIINPLSANPTKWSNTQTIRRQKPTNCLSVFDDFVGLVLKGLSFLNP